MRIDSQPYHTQPALLEITPGIEAAAQRASGKSSRPNPKAAWLALPAILLAIVCLAPYLDKAYTNDDPWFLLEARQVLKTPLQPMSFPVCWMGNFVCLERAGDLGAGAAQALMGYLLVPTILAGGQEWVAHLLQLLMLCAAAWEMVRLALRLGFERLHAAAAGVMLVAIPPVLATASTVMPDIAALTLGLSGLERLLAWRDERKWQQAAAAGLLLGLAPYARPHMALLMPLGALWLFREYGFGKAFRQLRREAYLWAPVILAAAILATVILVTRNRGHAAETRDSLIGTDLAIRNLSSYLQYLAYPVPFAGLWLAIRWRKAWVMLIGPAIPIVLHHFLADPSGDPVGEWPWLASAYGLVALVDLLIFCWRGTDWCNRLLSLWVLFPCCAVFYAHMPMKYLVGAMPAIVLLLLRQLSELERVRGWAVYCAVVLAATGFSCLLLKADAEFADCGRRAAAELIAPRVAAGEKVWYAGIMGFYWYAAEAGARISKPGEPGPNPGELLVVAFVEVGGPTLKRFPNRELVDSRSYKLPHGRTMGYGAALYTNAAGDAPWMWKPEATNDYQVWRIH